MRNLSLSLLSPEEMDTGTRRVTQTVEREIKDDEYINDLLSLLHKTEAELTAYIGKESSSEYTDLLFEQDKIRDNLYKGFRDYCISFCNNYDASKVEAGNLLNQIFHTRGFSMQDYGYTTESASLNALFEDLKEEKAKKAVDTLDAANWLLKLIEAQLDFEKVYDEKVDSESAKETPKIKKIKKGLSEQMYALLNYIETNAEVLNKKRFKPLAEKLDEIIVDIVSIAKARQTRKMNASVKQENADNGENKAVA